MRTARLIALVVALLAASAWAPSARAARPASVVVVAEAGKATAVQAALRRRGLRVNRRAGDRLQVVARSARQRQALRTIPGVRQVAIAPSAYPDEIVGQGVDRTGASALADVANGGAGLRIAVVDLGFGTALGPLQAAGELPPPPRLSLVSFDPAGGIAGTNAYGNPTDHGEIVAQTVYDYAPNATYVFVSYHTVADFVAAVDWLSTQRIDVAVHSNNFLEGPFDGTSSAARAVDRAAASGILWFNSAGNYGQKHWSGAWVDADGDGALDWPGSTPWTIRRDAFEAMTFHVSWRNPVGAPPTDLDLAVELQRPDGGWDIVSRSTDRQVDGAPPAERISGIRPPAVGTYRVRVSLASGPPPASPVTLYSREDEVSDAIGAGDVSHSVPTPADAAGAIAVAAVDFRSNNLVRYSSRGPTDDGRPKPDIAAPTDTDVATIGGDTRDVGGTSIAAPNAAGAAAALLASLRAAGIRPSATDLRALLARDALDLGPPGPDTTFGAGRLRVDVEPPSIRPITVRSARPLRRTVPFSVAATDAGSLATWALSVDGVRLREGRVARDAITAPVATARLADGPHEIVMEVGDGVGNRGRATWRVVTDNSAPTLTVTASTEPGARPVVAADDRLVVPRQTLRLDLLAADAIARRVDVSVTVVDGRGRAVARRRLDVASGRARALSLAKLARGRYLVRVSAVDTAGNTATAVRVVRVT